MADAPFQIRAAHEDDRVPLALVFAGVTEERDGIGAEPPVDIEARAASWTPEGTIVSRRVKQYRRQSGELWDTIEMGLLL